MNKAEYEALSPEEKERYKAEILRKKYGGVAPVVGTPTNNQQPNFQQQQMNQGIPQQGEQYAMQNNGFAQSQYGSDAYDLSMQSQQSGFGNQSEYGQSDFRNMYGNAPNQQYDDNSSLPMTLEDSERENKKGRRRGKKNNNADNAGAASGGASGKDKIVRIIIIVLAAVVIIGFGAFAVLKLGVLSNFGIGGQPSGGETPSAVESGGSGGAASSANSAFVGTWALSYLKDNSNEYKKDDIKSIVKDDEGYLLLFDDGKMEMKLIGNGSALSGTWAAASDTECAMDIGGSSPVTASLSNNVLHIEYNNQIIEFEKTANTASERPANTNTNNNSSSLIGNNTNTNANSNTTNTNTNASNTTNPPDSNTNGGGDSGGTGDGGNGGSTSGGGGTSGGGTSGGGGFADVD